jgi:hypothetical protein
MFTINRYKDISMARQPIGISCVIEPSSELNQLLQHSFAISGCKYEYNNANNAARRNGLELSGFRFYGRCRWSMPLHDTNQSIHVSPSHNRRTRHRYEFKHCNIEIKSETALIGLFESIFNPVIIHIASLTLKLWWAFSLPICGRLRHCLRKRSRGFVNFNVLTQSSPEQ